MTFVRLSIEPLKIDEKKMVKVIRKAIRSEMRNAIRAFMRAAIPKIPVDSGMSRGAFLHLGRLLRYPVPIRPQRTNQRYYHLESLSAVGLGGRTQGHAPKGGVTIRGKRFKRGQFIPATHGVSKTPQLGARLTTVNSIPATQLRLPDLVVNTGSKLTFRMSVDIFHFTLNDLFGSVGTGPWRAMESGRLAFIRYMNVFAVKRLPPMQAYLIKSRLAVKQSGMSKTSFRPVLSSGELGDISQRDLNAFELGITGGEGISDLPVGDI